MWVTIHNAKKRKRYNDWYLHKRNDQRKEFISFEKATGNVEKESSKGYDCNPEEIWIEEARVN